MDIRKRQVKWLEKYEPYDTPIAKISKLYKHLDAKLAGTLLYMFRDSFLVITVKCFYVQSLHPILVALLSRSGSPIFPHK